MAHCGCGSGLGVGAVVVVVSRWGERERGVVDRLQRDDAASCRGLRNRSVGRAVFITAAEDVFVHILPSWEGRSLRAEHVAQFFMSCHGQVGCVAFIF